jgi:hypothetical protein
MKKFLIAFIVLQCAVVVFCLGPAGPDPIRPDPTLTPGATLNVGLAQLCTPGYTQTVRNVPASLTAAVYAEYGIKHVPGTHEVDHLISLELGGSNDVKNLWPQTYALPYGAHQKDNLENYLHRQVCAGKMSLADAQHDIAADWIAAYQKAGLK